METFHNIRFSRLQLLIDALGRIFFEVKPSILGQFSIEPKQHQIFLGVVGVNRHTKYPTKGLLRARSTYNEIDIVERLDHIGKPQRKHEEGCRNTVYWFPHFGIYAEYSE
ncbi:Uncharacterized protein Fot_32174 [Forsythia ovata]|uniref:Uncharacterized protein n=1 Tax=Forsythia ovata TaxID=205694 RepID=A0ABD1T720_9LAMI